MRGGGYVTPFTSSEAFSMANFNSRIEEMNDGINEVATVANNALEKAEAGSVETVVWSNAAPREEFPAQTVQLSSLPATFTKLSIYFIPFGKKYGVTENTNNVLTKIESFEIPSVGDSFAFVLSAILYKDSNLLDSIPSNMSNANSCTATIRVGIFNKNNNTVQFSEGGYGATAGYNNYGLIPVKITVS